MDRAPDGQPATQAPQAMHLEDLPVSGLTVAAQSTLTVTMGSMQKKSNIFKDAQLKEGWNALCAVILVSGSAPVTGYTLNIVSKDDSDLSVKVDDLCLTETNKLTKPDAFSGIFEKANSFDTSVLSVAEQKMFSLFSGARKA